jgi:flagellar transcriptional activator FlhD
LRRGFQNAFHGDSQGNWPVITTQICESILEPTMTTTEQLLAEIREANLTYLMLAQNLIRHDRAGALFRLGMSEEAADLVSALSPAQMLKIASGNMLLCRFRVDDDIVWNLLTNHTASKVDNDATTKLHASILMAGRFSEAL